MTQKEFKEIVDEYKDFCRHLRELKSDEQKEVIRKLNDKTMDMVGKKLHSDISNEDFYFDGFHFDLYQSIQPLTYKVKKNGEKSGVIKCFSVEEVLNAKVIE